jgi:hypothetical protein
MFLPLIKKAFIRGIEGMSPYFKFNFCKSALSENIYASFAPPQKFNLPLMKNYDTPLNPTHIQLLKRT